jgi:hypothetical protein
MNWTMLWRQPYDPAHNDLLSYPTQFPKSREETNKKFIGGTLLGPYQGPPVTDHAHVGPTHPLSDSGPRNGKPDDVSSLCLDQLPDKAL